MIRHPQHFRKWFTTSGVWICQMAAGVLGVGGYALLLRGSAFVPFVLMISGLVISVASAFCWAYSVDKEDGRQEP